MAGNSKQTSTRVASVAGKTLQSGDASSGSSAQTGAKTEDRASRALDNPNSAPVTKTLAGSVVSQSNKKR